MTKKTATDTSPGAPKRRITLERTYSAPIEQVWDLWTMGTGWFHGEGAKAGPPPRR